MSREELIKDLSPFGDIGDSVVKVSETPKHFNVKLTRDMRPLKLAIERETGRIQCTWGTAQPRHFSNFAAMLASDIFANLRRWADAQKELLRGEVPSAHNLIPVNAINSDGDSVASVEAVDAMLNMPDRSEKSTEVLLIDGPAGIGKTNLIGQLAFERADTYRTSGRPLILHVKSRGRVLSNLLDLMAFSLQTIRSQITYDQIPVLAKHGLVTIAIDGFDELADPNGYEMAWAQLNELVVSVRGQGTLILAGRDTFVGRDRLVRDVGALREGVDVVNALTLSTPSAEQAKEWLKKHQWSDASFKMPAVSVLLEDGSFALRPVFLKLLAFQVKARDLRDRRERYLTRLLVDHMIQREAALFGGPVQAVMSEAARIEFISNFLCEVARQMADSQTESVEATELAWISEAALGDGVAPEILSLIQNRAPVIAFFINDERPGYRGFMHSHLLNYFVALVAIDAVGRGEIPKFLRRNLLGTEFLKAFADVVAESSVSSRDKFEAFWSAACRLPFSYSAYDRGMRNTGALVVAALPSVSTNEKIEIREFQIDDAVIRGVCPVCYWSNIEINQFDCRGADLSKIEFKDVKIGNLIADESLRVGPTFPVPTQITTKEGRVVVGLDDVTEWLGRQGRNAEEAFVSGLASESLKRKGVYVLLSRLARLRQYWLRDDGDDTQANKILNDEHWDTLSSALIKHEYLNVEVRQAAGRPSRFYHLRYRDEILREDPNDQDLRRLLAELQLADD